MGPCACARFAAQIPDASAVQTRSYTFTPNPHRGSLSGQSRCEAQECFRLRFVCKLVTEPTMTSDADGNGSTPVILRRAIISDLACIVDFNQKMAKVRAV